MPAWLSVILLLLALCSRLMAQVPLVTVPEDTSILHSEKEQFDFVQNHTHGKQTQNLASDWFDVTYYNLGLNVSISSELLYGDAIIEGIAKEDGNTFLILDLTQTMYISTVTLNDTSTSFEQFATSCKIDLLHPTHAGEKLHLEVNYAGLPVVSDFGNFVFGSHAGTPWVWSLSEPYGARDWFPCKDTPNDKADSSDVTVTVDSSFRVGSNGILVSVVDNNDATKTHHWKERYPIAPYLISVAMTNYTQFSNWFHYSPTDSMEILNYVLPEHYSQAETSLVKTVGMLEIYSNMFGLYPFIKEKYGYSDFGFGGAMEHQTMTSTTTYQEGTLAHELAHQWFGDMITLKSWQHLWLNEGFAQYCEALYMGKKYGESMYWLYINAELYKAHSAVGSIFVTDTSVVSKLFTSNLVYSKGASFLHMLRHVLGDSVFFHCMYNYANDPELRYSNASTEDFQSVCESTSGKDLNYLFKEWIYGEKYPKYSYWWRVSDSTDGYTLQLGVKQVTGTTNPPVFTMPVDFEFKGGNLDTTITLLNAQGLQFYTIRLDEKPDSVFLDPKGWILRDVNEVAPNGQPFPEPYRFSLSQNYPNPFNSETVIPFSIKKDGTVSIQIYSMTGQYVTTLLNKLQYPGYYSVRWNAVNEPSVLYFCRLSAGGVILVQPMLLIK